MNDDKRHFIDQLSQLLLDKLPADLRYMRDDLHQNFSDILEAKLSAWGLVTRDEFDNTVAQLQKCRDDIDALKRCMADPTVSDRSAGGGAPTTTDDHDADRTPDDRGAE